MDRRARRFADVRPTVACRYAFAAVLALATPALAWAQSPTPIAATAPDSGSTLKPGDIIRLRIWREPDLSGDFPLDPNGVAVLPKLGPTRVTDQAPDALKRRLIAAYAEYLNHPSIEVTFLRRVQVLGAVRNPGLYPVDPTMTLGDAVALAGGTTPDGNPNRLALIRDGVKLSRSLSHGTRIADTHIRSGDEIFVPERSWISRNPGIVATIITASVSLFVALHR
ncbi:MAG TPA: polysaccharide biosynthesis/export family protein [Gemmatimonadaceae bacterium]